MSKYGAIIKEATNQKTSKQENQKTGKPENKSAINMVEEPKEKDVNLSIKVPESKRRHWVSEAKKQGTSLTAVIIESLNNRFGDS